MNLPLPSCLNPDTMNSMSPTTKRIVLSCLTIGIVICVCLILVGLAAGGLSLLQPQLPISLPTLPVLQETRIPGVEGNLPAPRLTERPPTGPATANPSTPGAPDSGGAQSRSNIPPDISRQMDEIQEQVEELRGLEPRSPVKRTLLTRQQLLQRIKEDFFKDTPPEEARKNSIVLAAFGLLEPGFDLVAFYTDLYAEQVAGYYDHDKKAMYVIQEEGFKGPERLTYAHEYTHVLQDQTYDIENGLGQNQKACQEDSERCAAVRALLEGEATLLETQWLTGFASPQDIREIQEFYNRLQIPVYNQAPAFIREDFTFPYREGSAFVQALVQNGGWGAVNSAYENLPLSTEQILHPERYPADVPLEVNLPDLAPVLGNGWSELNRGVMGEWYTYLILGQGLDPAARLNERAARQAAEGWGGDAYAVYSHGVDQKTVLAFSTVWDTIDDARQFAAAFRRYATTRFGDPVDSQNSFFAWQNIQGYHTFHLDNRRTTWILAQDAVQAERIWQAIRE